MFVFSKYTCQHKPYYDIMLYYAIYDNSDGYLSVFSSLMLHQKRNNDYRVEHNMYYEILSDDIASSGVVYIKGPYHDSFNLQVT